jgi:ATP-dependent exoDNAse (exonuclease V) beta subunit
LRANHAPKVIRASAGTGKTFQLSSHYLRLLLLGESPDRIVATTFTRKAAGEIRDRIIQRLLKAAADPTECAALGEACGIKKLTEEQVGEALDRIVRSQHRLLIMTLDSLFVRVAKLFCHELGFPPDWRMQEEAVDSTVMDEALQQLCLAEDPTIIRELTQILSRRDQGRAVHQRFAKVIQEQYGLLAEAPYEAWGLRVLPDRSTLEQETALLRHRVRELSIPLTKEKKPHKSFEKMKANLLLDLEGRRWKALLESTILTAINEVQPTFSKVPIPESYGPILRPLVSLAAAEMTEEIHRRTLGIRALLQAFDAHYSPASMQAGIVSLQRLKQVVATSGRLGKLPELYLRLDRSIGHLLLDEFQDTATLEWSLLEPLVDEILSQAGEERSFLCVGDVKQAIYGWRGGNAEILGEIPKRWPHVVVEPMTVSRRCSSAVIEFVNQVFQNLGSSPGLKAVPNSLERWRERFETHAAVPGETVGEVQLLRVRAPKDSATEESPAETAQLTPIAEAVITTVRDLLAAAPRSTIGILVRTNQQVQALIQSLRGHSIPASEEGGVPVTSNRAVLAICSLLQCIAHPGDSAAWLHISQTPLAAVMDVTWGDSPERILSFTAHCRSEIARFGLSEFLSGIIRRSDPQYTEEERLRVRQFLELVFLAEDREGRDIDQFLAWIPRQRVRDLAAEQVRVMTVHQSKGLEFDAVLLPELDDAIGGGKGGILVERAVPSGLIQQIVATPSAIVTNHNPELQRLSSRQLERDVTESLSVLYVALTRARHALFILLSEEATPDTLSAGGILSGTVAAHHEGTLWEQQDRFEVQRIVRIGDRGWAKNVFVPSQRVSSPLPGPVQLPISTDTNRFLTRVRPSQHEGETRYQPVSTAQETARYRGQLIHLFLSLTSWGDEELPNQEQFFRKARAIAAPSGVTVTAILETVWTEGLELVLRSPLQGLFNRLSYQRPDHLELRREERFGARIGDRILVGTVDRLVIEREAAGSPERLHLIDFKSDRVTGGDLSRELLRRYREQLEQYRGAVSKLLKVQESAVRCTIASLYHGMLVEVPEDPGG